MKVYFVGAHGTGKTTLAKHVSEKWKLPLITEVARRVLADMEKGLSEISSDHKLIDWFQSRIWEEQLSAEGDECEFVSDRSFDCVAYSALNSGITKDIVSGLDFDAYMDKVRSSVVFFVRPFASEVKADGVRQTNMDDVLRIDGMVQLLLEMYNIPHIMIQTPLLRDRIRTVDHEIKTRNSKRENS